MVMIGFDLLQGHRKLLLIQVVSNLHVANVNTFLVCLQRSLPTTLVLNNSLRISILPRLGTGSAIVGVVNLLLVAILELWHPLADVVAIGVKLFTLEQRVEDPKVWLRVYPDAGREPLFRKAWSAHGSKVTFSIQPTQPPLLLAKSPSIKFSIKNRSPFLQSIKRSLARKQATIMRHRLCM